MRFATCSVDGETFNGAATDDGMIALSPECPVWPMLRDVVRAGGLACLAEVVEGCAVTHKDAFDLRLVRAITRRVGAVEEIGPGAGVLDDPARRIASHGQSIDPGKIIRSGRFIQPIECPQGPASTLISPGSVQSALHLSKGQAMPVPTNRFKQALRNGELQLACWIGLGDPYISEISAGAGFDCLVIDAEHSPNDLRSIIAQLQVMAARDVNVAVRPPVGETWIIKQLLDAGAQTLVVPMVESGAHAEALVRAVQYPPKGVRGVGPALARASDFGGIPDYVTAAGDEICLIVQVESRAGLAALDEILAVEGVDGVFIGPADLAADMGYPGVSKAPEVDAAIFDALERTRAAGKVPGVLTLDPDFQAACYASGARFIATDIDVTLFAKAMRGAAQAAKARFSGS